MRILDDIYYIGVNDKRIDLFEGQYDVPNGMCYNSYIIIDEKIAVFDTVDKNFTNEWLDNVAEALCGRKPDYLIIQHMEPDHSANIQKFLKVYPECKVVGNAKTFTMIDNFFDIAGAYQKEVVTNGGKLSLGSRELTFIFAPMVHWPEVMVTYDAKTKTLFSADAFGKFGAIDTDEEWDCEARRYYFGIVGKYGDQVQALLKKLSGLEVSAILPLHGPYLLENIPYYIEKYDTWSSYRPESKGVTVAYCSIYGNTKKAVDLLVEKLKQNGCPHVAVHDLARTDMAEAVEDAFRYENLVLASPTYNTSIFPYARHFLDALVERNYQNRTIGIIENGSWAPQAAKVMKDMLSGLKNINILEPVVSIKSAVKPANIDEVDSLAKELTKNYPAPTEEDKAKRNLKALFKIGYGLYVITSNDGKKDNGMICNTVTQVTNSPDRISVAINKEAYTHYVVKNTGVMNINCLSVEAPFAVFERFGFKSGRNADKFNGFDAVLRSDNGIAILPKFINAVMSLKVEQYLDLGSHGLFICAITEARVISDKETMTYNYYQENVKPKPAPKQKRGFVCRICGYVYEGETLPEDFICPICKHGAADFEPLNK